MDADKTNIAFGRTRDEVCAAVMAANQAPQPSDLHGGRVDPETGRNWPVSARRHPAPTGCFPAGSGRSAEESRDPRRNGPGSIAATGLVDGQSPSAQKSKLAPPTVARPATTVPAARVTRCATLEWCRSSRRPDDVSAAERRYADQPDVQPEGERGPGSETDDQRA